MNFLYYLNKLDFNVFKDNTDFDKFEHDFFYNYHINKFENNKKEAILFLKFRTKEIYSKNSNNLVALYNLYMYVLENTYVYLGEYSELFDEKNLESSRQTKLRIFNSFVARGLAPKLEEPNKPSEINEYEKEIEILRNEFQQVDEELKKLYEESNAIIQEKLKRKRKLELKFLPEIIITKDWLNGADDRSYTLKSEHKKKINAFYYALEEYDTIEEELLALSAFVIKLKIGAEPYISLDSDEVNSSFASYFAEYEKLQDNLEKLRKRSDNVENKINNYNDLLSEANRAYNDNLRRYQGAQNNVPIFQKLIIDFRYLCAKVDLSK